MNFPPPLFFGRGGPAYGRRGFRVESRGKTSSACSGFRREGQKAKEKAIFSLSSQGFCAGPHFTARSLSQARPRKTKKKNYLGNPVILVILKRSSNWREGQLLVESPREGGFHPKVASKKSGGGEKIFPEKKKGHPAVCPRSRNKKRRIAAPGQRMCATQKVKNLPAKKKKKKLNPRVLLTPSQQKGYGRRPRLGGLDRPRT